MTKVRSRYYDDNRSDCAEVMQECLSKTTETEEVVDSLKLLLVTCAEIRGKAHNASAPRPVRSDEEIVEVVNTLSAKVTKLQEVMQSVEYTTAKTHDRIDEDDSDDGEDDSDDGEDDSDDYDN
jgi:hypothetical protein